MHRINLSDHWSREEHDGVVHLSRRFGKPRLADAKETIWLTGRALTRGVLRINGQEVLSFAGGVVFEAEIGGLLTSRNEAVLVLHEGGEVSEAAMEIR